ncbi:hypothetical protein BCV72DRAFT_325401 [Rhizopus microsporus var. microsporus]|uniref:Uncharacterized protein n=1 Tax=Rhizopus microsporus var. microsporus TaxID=86635 RepID=A0A1X0R756_RHIZD|nr:hypothetical protein BCV72DRAFT_325401 [Rhizopus microsporus var. microsporus]
MPKSISKACIKSQIEDVKKTKKFYSSLTNYTTSDIINDKKKLKASCYSSKGNSDSVKSISVDNNSSSSPNDVSLTSNLNNHDNQKIFYINQANLSIRITLVFLKIRSNSC